MLNTMSLKNQLEENYNSVPMDFEKKLINLAYKPTPSDRELEWDKSKVLLSKTDSRGTILYANESFINVCGYDDYELMNKSHNMLRHPDMPKVIFKLLWENLHRENSYHAIIKNMSKTGRYFWVANDIKANKDHYGITSYTGQQSSVADDVIKNYIEPLYKKLMQIEKASGVQASENYLVGFLEEKGKTYVGYIDSLVYNIQEEDQAKKLKNNKKGFFSSMFSDEKAKSTKKQ
jgi:PAS domain S-box-containing protein